MAAQGFHGNTGKTIDHALTPESLSSALGVFPHRSFEPCGVLLFYKQAKVHILILKEIVLVKTQQLDFPEAVCKVFFFPLELQEDSAFI